MSKKLEVKIGKDGNITCESINFEGKACDSALKFLNKVGEKIDDKKKPEYFKEPPTDALISGEK